MGIKGKSMMKRFVLFIVCCACANAGQQPSDVVTDGDSAIQGRPIDLVRYARIKASATAKEGFFVREAEESIATVRDDFEDTAWRPPDDEETSVEIDFEPWLGRMVPVREITLSLDGGKPDVLQAELYEACGGKRHATYQIQNDRTDISDDLAGCIVLRFKGHGFAVKEIHVISLDPSIEPVNPIPDEIIKPATIHPESGVIEGFYGRPWSWDERKKIMAVLALSGLTFYMYAPKDDPRHRHLWREPYPQEDMDHFAELANLARNLGIKLVFGISPFLDYAEGTDYEVLLSKAKAFLDIGMHGIGILADDIEFESDIVMDKALGELHAGITNRLFTDLKQSYPDVGLYFTPTVYSDERLKKNPGGEDYLRAIASLSPEIRVLWTGPMTSSATMAAKDMETVTSLIGRKPLIWDNFWANDGGDAFFGRILAGAFTGRSPDLLEAVTGIAHNPSIQGSLDRLMLAMFGRFMEDPVTADRAAQVERAITIEQLFATGHKRSADFDSSVLRFVLDVFDGNAKSDPAFRDMEAKVDVLLAAINKDELPVIESWEALKVFARMAVLPWEMWHSGLSSDLFDDLAWPIEAVRFQGEQGLWSLALLGERMAGRDGAEAAAKAQIAAENAVQIRFTFSMGKVQGLFDAVSGIKPEMRGFSKPGPIASLPACHPDNKWSYKPFATPVDEVAVFGLPGALVNAGNVLWTPPHAGKYHAIIVERHETGWSFEPIELVCEGGDF